MTPQEIRNTRRQPKISVIVPIYNAEKYLEQCLESIESQIEKDIEIICVNDGSTDSCPDILAEHAVLDRRIHIVNKENGGYGSACNVGLEHARGKWISIVEPDDWIVSNMYSSILYLADELEEKGAFVDIIKTPYMRIMSRDDGYVDARLCYYAHRVKPPQQPFTIEEAPILLRYHPSIWSALYRRTFLERENIRFKEIPGAGWADNPFMADTLISAESIVYLDKPFYCYRETDIDDESKYLRKNPMVPVERWMDVMDSANKRGMEDEGVLAILYMRAFNNLARMKLAGCLGDRDMNTVEREMFKMMRPEIVFAADTISPSEKNHFAEVMRITTPKFDKKPYAMNTFRERLRDVRIAGYGNSIRTLYKKLGGKK